jgi:hypothetical protein
MAVPAVASLAVARAAGTALLWIARPAANANLPAMTSRQAVLELAVGIAAALWIENNALLLIAVTALIVRAVLGFSYSSWGGIHRASLLWVRLLSAVTAVAIAVLPESYR